MNMRTHKHIHKHTHIHKCTHTQSRKHPSCTRTHTARLSHGVFVAWHKLQGGANNPPPIDSTPLELVSGPTLTRNRPKVPDGEGNQSIPTCLAPSPSFVLPRGPKTLPEGHIRPYRIVLLLSIPRAAQMRVGTPRPVTNWILSMTPFCNHRFGGQALLAPCVAESCRVARFKVIARRSCRINSG